MRLVKITNRQRQNFLDKHGVYPVYEEQEAAYYKRTKELIRLLEEVQVIETFYQYPTRRKR